MPLTWSFGWLVFAFTYRPQICWNRLRGFKSLKTFFFFLIIYWLLLSQSLTRFMFVVKMKENCGRILLVTLFIFALFFSAFYYYYRANKSTTKRTLLCQFWKHADSHTHKYTHTQFYSWAMSSYEIRLNVFFFLARVLFLFFFSFPSQCHYYFGSKPFFCHFWLQTVFHYFFHGVHFTVVHSATNDEKNPYEERFQFVFYSDCSWNMKWMSHYSIVDFYAE